MEERRIPDGRIVPSPAQVRRRPFPRAGAMLIAGVNPVLTAVTLCVIVPARHYGAAPFEIGLVVGCSGIGGLLGSLLGGLALEHAGPVATMWLLAVLMGTVAVFASLSPSLRHDAPSAPSAPARQG